MKKSLSELKNMFGQEGNKGETNNFNNTGYYPFWNMKSGQRAVIRFLQDKDETNPRGFLVEKLFHNLTINGQRKAVPCLSMYGDDCPICKVSQEYYKAKDEVNGKKYWKKKQYMAQCLIVEDPLPADDSGETHEGKVRLVSLGFQIYNIIKEAFTSDELESVPYDFEDGYDFIIKKSDQGQYASYAVGTKFSNKPRSLTEEELGAVEEGLTELSTLLPKHPGIEKVQAMLDADLNGEAFDDGFSNDGESTPAWEAPAKAAPAKTSPSKSEPAPQSGGDADADVEDMIATIRARRAAAAKG